MLMKEGVEEEEIADDVADDWLLSALVGGHTCLPFSMTQLKCALNKELRDVCFQFNQFCQEGDWEYWVAS